MTTDVPIIAPAEVPRERTSALIGRANALEGRWASFTPEPRAHSTRTHLVRATASTQTVKRCAGASPSARVGSRSAQTPTGPPARSATCTSRRSAENTT